MAGNILGEPRPAFRIRRPLPSDGSGLDIDKTIAEHLAELDELLGKRVFALKRKELERLEAEAQEAERAADAAERRADAAERRADAALSQAQTPEEIKKAVAAEKNSARNAAAQAKREAAAAAALARAADATGGASLKLREVLPSELTPKRVTGKRKWRADSLADRLQGAEPHEAARTLAEIIDSDPELSELSAAFDGAVREDLFTMPEKAQAILGGRYPNIRDYLVLLGHSQGIDDVKGLKNFIVNTSRGAAKIADYAIVSAARRIVARKGLNVPDLDDDDGRFVKDVRRSNLSFSAVSFEKGVLRVVDKRLLTAKELSLLAGTKLGDIPEELKDELVRRMKVSPIPFTKDNVDFLLPPLLADVAGDPGTAPAEPVPPEESEKDFDVEFFEDDAEQIQVSRASVKCAAQLYYTMVAGDELDVFGVVDFFTRKYMLRGGIELLDRRLRDDLQNYVFSERFTDLRSGRLVDRTRRAERQMFARQVFSTGGEVTDDVIVNEDFPRLWKVLILESAQYLEHARESPHPDSFVSRQGVMQAVEDLQYNLGTHCTGMATVITPLMHQELNFVIRRILMHPEVVRQVVPIGGSWWRVVERLHMEANHTRPNATALYNKARLGFEIIKSIAEYNPVRFENDDQFSAFISQVDAFITTQSILQEALTDQLKREQEEPRPYEDPGPPPTAEPVTAAPAASNGQSPADEWDF